MNGSHAVLSCRVRVLHVRAHIGIGSEQKNIPAEEWELMLARYFI